MEEFHRIRRLPPYVFEQVNQRQGARARNAGADIIDLGMGNPDLPAPPHVIEKLKETIGKPRTDRYSASRGIAGLAPAQAAYYARRFGVKLNPDTQVVATLGSKEGFANVAQAITAPGDVVLVPEPELSDPRLRLPDGGRRDPLGAGGADAGVLPRARARGRSIRSRSRSRSWSAIRRTRPRYVADLDFYQDLVAFAKKHGIFILSDLAYAEVYFDDNPPPSVLQVPGAMDVTVEFTSMSKTYLDAGLAHGLRGRQRAHHRGAGAREVLSRLRRLHADPGRGDRGAQRPGRLHPRDARRPTSKRRDVLVDSFGRAGWHVPPPARLDVRLGADPGAVPRARQPRVLQAAGREGRGRGRRPASASASTARAIVRIALVENEQRIRQAARNIRRFLETGAGKVAQRRSARDAALSRVARHSGSIHGCAAESRSCRPRHGRRVGRAR